MLYFLLTNTFAIPVQPSKEDRTLENNEAPTEKKHSLYFSKNDTLEDKTYTSPSQIPLHMIVEVL